MQVKKVGTIVLMVVAMAMVIFSGIMKLSQAQAVVDALSQAGVVDYIRLLGVMEIVFAALFIYPKTIKIGFILLSCYFAGAMATELSHGGSVINAAIPLILIWVVAFLRDSSIFLPTK